MPQCLKAIVGKEYTILLNIKEINISRSFHVYWACQICTGFLHWEANNDHPADQQNATSTQENSYKIIVHSFPLKVMAIYLNSLPYYSGYEPYNHSSHSLHKLGTAGVGS